MKKYGSHRKSTGGVNTGVAKSPKRPDNGNVSRGAKMDKGSGKMATGSQCGHHRVGKGPYAPT